jgi:hypothetical protein
MIWRIVSLLRSLGPFLRGCGYKHSAPTELKTFGRAVSLDPTRPIP